MIMHVMDAIETRIRITVARESSRGVIESIKNSCQHRLQSEFFWIKVLTHNGDVLEITTRFDGYHIKHTMSGSVGAVTGIAKRVTAS